jgi:amino acid transporter
MIDDLATRNNRLAKQRNANPSMGPFSVFIYALMAIGLPVASLIPFSLLAGLFPGTHMGLMLTVGAIICIFPAITYSIIGGLIRKNAADYFLTSRVFGPVVGLGASFALVLFSAVAIGMVLGQMVRVIVPVYMRSISQIANVPGMLLAAEFIFTPEGISIVGSTGIVLAFILAILSQRANMSVIRVGFFLLVVAWIALLVMLAFPSGLFAANWDRFMGDGTFDSVIGMAREGGMLPGLVTLGGLLAAMWIFYGFQAPVYVAGQIRNPGKSLFPGMFWAILVTWVAIGGSVLLLLRLTGIEWLSAQSFLSLKGVETLPWLIFYAAVSRSDPLWISVIGVVWVIALLNMVQIYFSFAGRIIAAWTEDGLLPAGIGFIHPQTKSPIIAILLTAMMSQLGVWMAARADNALSLNIIFVVVAIAVQLVPMAAASIAPFKFRTWFQAAGRPASLRVGPVFLISLTALISLAYIIGTLAYILSVPELAPTATGGLIGVAILFVFGAVYTAIRRTDRSKYSSLPTPDE